jgi:hypothetical protein
MIQKEDAIMSTQMTLCVYRRLDNRFEGLDDQSERGWELHDRRKEALHAVLEQENAWQIKDWGDTDDKKETHELVEILVELQSNPVVAVVVLPVLGLIGKLLMKAAETAVTEAVKKIIADLRQQQKEEKILDFSANIATQSGEIRITVYPQGDDADVTISVSGKNIDVNVKYNATEAEVQAIEDTLP